MLALIAEGLKPLRTISQKRLQPQRLKGAKGNGPLSCFSRRSPTKSPHKSAHALAKKRLKWLALKIQGADVDQLFVADASLPIVRFHATCTASELPRPFQYGKRKLHQLNEI